MAAPSEGNLMYDDMLATFRGEHAFDPEHLKTAYVDWRTGEENDDVTDDAVSEWMGSTLQRIRGLRCPRCEGRLVGVSLVDEGVFRDEDERAVREHLASQPEDDARVYLAASRVTNCRCVPVCRLCESDEAIVGISLAWPMPRGEIVDRLRAANGNTPDAKLRSRR
jgi:hypothetical protein